MIHREIAGVCIALIGAGLLGSCNSDDDALLSYQHTIQVGLYSMHTGNDTTLSDFSVYGIGREGIAIYDTTSLHSMYLNLNMHRCTTEFILKTQTLVDNMFVSYHKSLTPVSGSAGIAMEITIDSVGHTQTFIDSSVVVYKEIKYNESLENVRLYVY